MDFKIVLVIIIIILIVYIYLFCSQQQETEPFTERFTDRIATTRTCPDGGTLSSNNQWCSAQTVNATCTCPQGYEYKNNGKCRKNKYRPLESCDENHHLTTYKKKQYCETNTK